MQPNRYEVMLTLLNRLNRAVHSSDYTNMGSGCCGKCPYRFDPLLNRIEAAAYTNFQRGTLATWDYTKRYDLQPIRTPNATRCRLSVINKFADAQIYPE